jgi:hypothetical protein
VSELRAAIDAVERELEQLEAEGGRGYDAPACDCARALLARAEELGGGTGTRLIERAQSHVDSLRERLVRDRARVAARVSAVEERLASEQPELRRAVERGDLVLASRRAGRLARRADIVVRRSDEATPEAAPVRARGKPQRIQAYEDSVAEMVASLALARAVDVVPEDAGPYNALRIASEALDRMREISPLYLTVQLNRLEELATLLALPELPRQEDPKVLPKKKRR